MHKYFMQTLQLLSKSDISPVPLPYIKQHIKVDTDADDLLIETYVHAALELLEQATDRAYFTRQYREIYPYFPAFFELLKTPVLTVDKINYCSVDDEETELTEYYLLRSSNLRTVIRSLDYFPPTYRRPDAVIVDYTCGYEKLPRLAYQAVYLMTLHWYQNRSAVETGTIATEIPLGVESIIGLLRLY